MFESGSVVHFFPFSLLGFHGSVLEKIWLVRDGQIMENYAGGRGPEWNLLAQKLIMMRTRAEFFNNYIINLRKEDI